MAATFQVPSEFIAIDRLTRPIKVMMRGVVGFARKAELGVVRLDRQFIKLGRTINSLTGGFGVFLGTALAFSVLTNGIEIVADYEQANANLAAVSQATAEEITQLSKSSQLYGATTKFTASEVAGLQTELAKLGFTVPQILDATGGILALASATNTELPQAAAQVGAAIRAFGLEASDAQRVADVFAKSTSKSALDMTKLDVAMSKVAPVAKQFGFSIEEATALMANLADAGFDASTMATSTRSILLNLADSNGKLAKALGKPARTLPEITAAMVQLRDSGVDLAKMLDLTDKRSVAAFGNFLAGAESINVMAGELRRAGGFAEEMAKTQLDTLRGRLTILNSAYQGFILSLNESNSSFGNSLKFIIDVTAEMLNLASGLAKAESGLTDSELKIRKMAETMLTVLNIAKNLILAYAGLKVILFVVRAAHAAYSVVLGISTAMQWKSTFALKGNMLAMKAHVIATKAATFAARAFNIVLAANPIGLIVVGIIALGILITQMIRKWDEWGAAVSLFLGPIGAVITIIQSFRRNWDLIVGAFKSGGIIAGIKSIGIAIADAILQPIQQLAEIIENFTGVKLGSAQIASARSALTGALEGLAGEEQTGIVRTNSEPLNPEATREATQREVIENTQNQNLKIDINDPGGKASIDETETSPELDVQVAQTINFAGG